MARHEAALFERLLWGDGRSPGLAERSDVTLLGPATIDAREGVTSFTLRAMPSPELVRRLAERGIRIHARTRDAYSAHILEALGVPDCARVSLCHYTSPEEIGAFLAALEEIARSR
jgi:selenocysteine lyase/cysteine desulfurase